MAQLDEAKGRTFDLLPGEYNVKVKDDSVPDDPVVELQNVRINPGETLEKTAEFTQQGWLKIMALQGGKSNKYVISVGHKWYTSTTEDDECWLVGRGR